MKSFGAPLLFLILGLCLVQSKEWSYEGENGPENWPGVCVIGENQSPIDIVTDDLSRADLGRLKFIKYDVQYEANITNTGHSVQIDLNNNEELVVPRIETTTSTYILKQMHFHWPAEHTVDGKHDALEVHFVHYDKQYNNFSEALKHSSGIVVVASLFELHTHDNHDLTPILEGVVTVTPWVGPSTAIMNLKFMPLVLLPKDHTTYYRYKGSLTTPNCLESVLWFVLTEKLTVSDTQINIFKNLQSSKGSLSFNNRPIQKTGCRKVQHHLDGYSAASTTSSNLLFTLCNLLLVTLLFSRHKM
ncbi:carbonic anhydrase 2-like isoform X2 [Prorops nasuta]|uniref:carbonic anhydrase 2-like isoform X2 n=1 Tax=Prorops nasuta TaxID=863751 RepID=UPI0034CEAE4D